MDTKWQLTGTYFEACNCNVGCPCIYLSPPTNETCTVLVGWHIDQGHFGDVSLHNMNVAMAILSPGTMAQGAWKIALYVDHRASENQGAALTQIFSGQVGGHFGLVAPLVGEVLGIQSAAIVYQAEGRRRYLRIANVGEVTVEAVPGQGDAEITVSNPPLCIAPGYPAVVGKSASLHYDDYGLHWELSEKNGYYSPFSYQGS